MKLRRFNESKSNIDYDYIYDCFNEFKSLVKKNLK